MNSKLLARWHRIASAWNRFWFAAGDWQKLGMFRFFFALTLLVMYSLRARDFELYFSSQGFFTPEKAREFYNFQFRPLFLLFPDSDLLLQVLYGLLLLGLLGMVLGVVGRGLTWAVFLLHLVFFQRNFAITYGADSVATFWLFFLSFTQHNRTLRFLPRRWRKERLSATDRPDSWTSMGYRLIQVQLCVIYAFTGAEKLRGDQWWEGSALWYVMGNSQIVPTDLSFMQHVPWLVALMTFATLIFEIYFPFAILAPRTRRLWLSLGVFMHLGTAFLMGLPFFSLIMLSTYALFVTPPRVRLPRAQVAGAS